MDSIYAALVELLPYWLLYVCLPVLCIVAVVFCVLEWHETKWNEEHRND